MPVDKSKYPATWKTIALAIKDGANWTCQECDRPCRRPKQSWMEFVGELLENGDHGWYQQTCDEVKGDIVEKPQRFTLTVSHTNHDTTDNRPENLKALCSGCHLKYDADLHAKNAKATRARRLVQNGQLELLIKEAV
jgi:hypothetical protein